MKRFTGFACLAALLALAPGANAITTPALSRADALATLLREAESLHPLPPLTVLDKKLTAASGDKHDFFAIGKLAWANPKTADGFPWIRRDGPHNPAAASFDYDKNHYNTTLRRIHLLALAWHHTRDERHAAKAVSLIRAWFVDPATRMNPHFRYAAALPGVHEGMWIGIIEGVVLVDLIDDVRLLASSRSWTPIDDAALKRWFANYTLWMLESDFGQAESRATSNHGVWYAAQVATFALFTGDAGRVGPMIVIGRRILDEMQDAEGGFPQEIGRRQSQMYSIYMLHAYAVLADCGQRSAVPANDLWHYESANGHSLRRGVTWIAPFLSGEKTWPVPDMDKDAGNPTDPRALPCLRRAAKAWPDLAPLLDRTAARVFAEQPPSLQTLWLLTPADLSTSRPDSE